MRNLTSAEVCDICNVPKSTLAEWINHGLIDPVVKGGKGRGNNHELSISQSFAVFAGVVWRELGAGEKLTRDLVEFLSEIPVKELQRNFNKGKTIPLLPYQFGNLTLQPLKDKFVKPNPPTELTRITNLRKIWNEFWYEVCIRFPQEY